MKTTPNTIAALLEGSRTDQGLTQKQAADRLGCSLATYRMWEKGGWEPDRAWFPSLAAFAGIALAELLGIVELLTPDQVQLLRASGDGSGPSGGRKGRDKKAEPKAQNDKGKILSFTPSPLFSGRAA